MTPGLQADDRELVARFLARRDEEAFRALFRRHSPRLLAMARRLVGGGRGDAEDVVQDAWTRALRQLDRFEWRSTLATWLQSIVINCARERWRSNARLPAESSVAIEDAIGGGGVVHDGARTLDAAQAIDLDRAIASLPPGYREILVLHDVEGYTHEEIAALCGIAPGTSKSQLFHARRALRARLSGTAREETHHARR